MKRRDFLLAGGVGLLASCAAAQELAPEPLRLQFIDCHTHFYDPMRPQGVPWPGRDDRVLYRTMLPVTYEAAAEPLGIVGTVVVEASPWVEDNQWLLDLAAGDRFLKGVVGRLDPASERFGEHLERFARNPLYRGIRINHDELTAGLRGNLVERLRRFVELNLELDVNGGPAMPADVARLAAALPRLRIVINHCANLRIDGREPPREWREGMQAAARHANVFCKVSALVEQTGRERAPRDTEYYRPVLDALWNCFGEDRLIFGSNWPVSERSAPLADLTAIVREYFTARGPRAAAKFFRENSQTAYAWRPR